jgi:hypothetical protein
MSRRLLPALLLAAACGAPASDDADDDGASPDAGIDPARTSLDACAPGSSLELLWDVDNLHDDIRAMAIAPDGTVVLGTADGAVKQWSLGADPDAAPLPGGRPSYGTPFTDAGAVPRALAIAPDGASVVAGTEAVGVHAWSLPAADDLGSIALKGSPITAIAARATGEVVIADDSFGGAMRVVSIDGGQLTAPFETTLWGVTSFATRAKALFVAGHDYGMAAIERRDLTAPELVADVWDTLEIEGWIRAVAVSRDGAWVATAGDGHVLVLAAADLAAGPVARAEIASRSIAFTAGGRVAYATDTAVVLAPRALDGEIASVPVTSPVAIGVDPSGERLVVASTDGHLRAYTCR